MNNTLPYPVILGSGLMNQITKHIPSDLSSYAFVIITDNTVKKLYANKPQEAMKKHGHLVDIFSFPAGEKTKTRETKAKLESLLLKKAYGRDTCLIALGGGVVGDLAGFTAATYMRGIPYIYVPTSLLAMIDSSIGGKTAVNTPEGKNLIGAFHQPSAVIIDLNCLKTLPEKQLINGWVEALKIFLTCDKSTFHQAIQKNTPTPELIQRAIDLKANITQADPFESGLRAVLNYGHTIGHALEKISDYKLLHGYAVGYGILVETQLSYQLGLIHQTEKDLIFDTFATLGIKKTTLKKFDIHEIIAQTKRDKKVKSNQVRYVLLKNIGSHQLRVIEDHEIKQALESLQHAR
jgi:3-dehydroquinate synthase